MKLKKWTSRKKIYKLIGDDKMKETINNKLLKSIKKTSCLSDLRKISQQVIEEQGWSEKQVRNILDCRR